jgi:hypothetical protein
LFPYRKNKQQLLNNEWNAASSKQGGSLLAELQEFEARAFEAALNSNSIERGNSTTHPSLFPLMNKELLASLLAVYASLSLFTSRVDYHIFGQHSAREESPSAT